MFVTELLVSSLDVCCFSAFSVVKEKVVDVDTNAFVTSAVNSLLVEGKYFSTLRTETS